MIDTCLRNLLPITSENIVTNNSKNLTCFCYRHCHVTLASERIEIASRCRVFLKLISYQVT